MASRMTGKKSFSEIAAASCGWVGTALSIYSMLGLVILASTAYAASWYKYTNPLLVQWGWISPESVALGTEETQFWCPRTLVITALMGLIYPVCCLKNLGPLATMSVGAVFVYLGVLAILMFYYFGDFVAQSETEWVADRENLRRYTWTLQAPELSKKYFDALEQDHMRPLELNHPCWGMFTYKSA